MMHRHLKFMSSPNTTTLDYIEIAAKFLTHFRRQKARALSFTQAATIEVVNNSDTNRGRPHIPASNTYVAIDGLECQILASHYYDQVSHFNGIQSIFRKFRLFGHLFHLHRISNRSCEWPDNFCIVCVYPFHRSTRFHVHVHLANSECLGNNDRKSFSYEKNHRSN